MDKKNIIVSILIPCYNRSEMLGECLNSFINQTFTNWEIILVDDGSEEDLKTISKKDDRIKYFRQEHSGVSVVGRKYALSKATGKYVTPFDSDDLATDVNLLKELVEALENNPSFDIAYCDHWQQCADGRRIRIKYDNIGLYNHKKLYERMLKRQLIAHGATLWRKENMPEYDEKMAPADDWDLFLTAVENGLRFCHIPKRLWTYRIGHPRESGTKAMDEACKKILAKRGIKT